jgi:hypothetical protein
MTFFEDKENKKEETEEQENNQEEAQKIKLGESEFTTEELEQLVGKAKKIGDFEAKQGQEWEEVVESWGKRGERIGELKKKVKELEETTKPQVEPTDREKLKEQVIAEAREFGLLTKEEAEKMFEQVYETRRSGERMLSSVKRAIRDGKRQGWPTVTEEKLLKFMADPSNPKDPSKAYKLMFEKEIDELKEKKLASIKKTPMYTDEKSTAGGKEYKPPKVTKENLGAVLREHFQRGQNE